MGRSTRAARHPLPAVDQTAPAVPQQACPSARPFNDSQELFDQSAEASILCDAQGVIVGFNRMAELLTGLKREQALGKPYEELIQAGVMAGPNGERRYFEQAPHPVETAAGLHLGSIARDVTERKLAEALAYSRAAAALQESQANLQTLFDTLQDFLFILEPHGRIVQTNPAVQQRLGYTPAELAGMTVLDLHPPERRAEAADILAGILDGALDSCSIPLMAKDGHLIPVETKVTHGAWAGQPALFGVSRDITVRLRVLAAEHEQRALAEALRDSAAALNSTLDFEHILDSILENVNRVVQHDAANIMLVDNDASAYVVREHGYAERGHAEVIRSFRLSLAQARNLQQMIASGHPVIIPDTASDEVWQRLSLIPWERSYAGIPIQQKGRVIGFINLISETPGFFRTAQFERLQAFADQIALAVENTRLYVQAQRYAEQMASLHEIGLSITAQLDHTQLMHSLVEQMRKLLNPDVFYLGTYDANTQILEHPFFYYFGERLEVQPRNVYQSPGLSGEVIFTRRSLHILDMTDAQEMSRHNSIVHAARIIGTRTFVGAPMLFRGQVVGVLSIQHIEANAFDHEQIRLLETIAAQAAVALVNSRLYERAQQEIAQRRAAEESLKVANRQLLDQVARIELLQSELKEQAIRDSLTGVFNRRYLDGTLEREIARAQRDDLPVAVIMMDIDHFKAINDAYGHKAGDLMLQALGELLMNNTRAGDIACRFGGEEFVVVMPGAIMESAVQRAEQLRLQFAALRVRHDEQEVSTTLSLGVAAYPQHGATGEQVLTCADRALYQLAKQAGRNRVGVYGQ